MNWKSLNSLQQLDEIQLESQQRPVLIFKHSTRCAISSASLDRLERKWKIDNPDLASAYLLDLISYREISNEISSRFSIYHQSPQAIVLFKDKVIYEESHFSISYDDIESQIQTAAVG
jgi:bacillithiol system protein YtxJ